MTAFEKNQKYEHFSCWQIIYSLTIWPRPLPVKSSFVPNFVCLTVCAMLHELSSYNKMLLLNFNRLPAWVPGGTRHQDRQTDWLTGRPAVVTWFGLGIFTKLPRVTSAIFYTIKLARRRSNDMWGSEHKNYTSKVNSVTVPESDKWANTIPFLIHIKDLLLDWRVAWRTFLITWNKINQIAAVEEFSVQFAGQSSECPFHRQRLRLSLHCTRPRSHIMHWRPRRRRLFEHIR
jgi:hypothetical protein